MKFIQKKKKNTQTKKISNENCQSKILYIWLMQQMILFIIEFNLQSGWNFK